MFKDPNELIKYNDWCAYREIYRPVWKLKKERRLLTQSEPEEDPGVWHQTEKELQQGYHAGALAICILCAFLVMMFSCQRFAHAEVNMDIIADIESGGEPLAYNRESGAVGKFQITQGVVRDFNETMSSQNRYKLEDMYIPLYADEVANYYMNKKIPDYLKEFGIPDTTTSRLLAYNWGIGHLHKWFKRGSHWNQLPRETRQYVVKYFQKLNDQTIIGKQKFYRKN